MTAYQIYGPDDKPIPRTRPRMKALRALGMWMLLGFGITGLVFYLVTRPWFPGHVHRHDFDKAAVAYYRNPSPENAVVLQREKRLNRIVLYSLAADISVVAIGGCTGYWALGWVRRRLWVKEK